MIPYGHQSISPEDSRAVTRALKSPLITQGPAVQKFEQLLAKYCGAKYAVVTSSGTAALHLAYLAAGLKRNNEVITTPNTFVATTNMLLAVGAKPVFCDIRLDTYNMDESKIDNLVTVKTKAIVPVHFAGQPCDMRVIVRLAKKRHLKVIEDACHALGARYQGRRIGSLTSDMTVFSFHPVKSITTGEGGAIVTNRKNYYEKLQLLRSHGVYKNVRGKNVMLAMGYNYRMSDFAAALGISQLKRINTFIRKRRQVFQRYESELHSIKEIITPHEAPGNFSACHLYVIRVMTSSLREKLALFLKKNGIGINFHYPPVYAQPYYQTLGYRGTTLQNMEIYNRSCLTIPCYADLTHDQMRFIADRIRKFFST